MVKKRAKYTPEFKREVCEFAILDNITNSAKFHKVDRDTVGKWVKNCKLFGEKSFSYRKKRNVTQKKKLDDKTLLKIKKIKDKEPKLSLQKIKDRLDLDCDISLISRKLKKIKIEPHKKEKINSLNIFINVLSQNIKHGEIYSLYQINITDNNSKNHFIGFSSFKNNTNLCIFMDYVLSNIQGLDQFKNIKKIKTNIEHLDQLGNKAIFNRFIKDKYNIDLEYTSDVNLPQNIKLDYVKSTGIEDLFKDTYKKLITEKSIQELESNVIIPPIFIDDFIKDTNKIISFNNYWNVLSLPDQQRNILANVIEEIEKLGDAAKISFDFDNALELYNKIYLTTLNCNNVNEVKANSLLKQADIYYHLDNFDLSRTFFSDALKVALKLNLYEISSKAYFYLGMINYSLALPDEANNSYNKSLEEHIKNKDNNSLNYHNTKVRKYINLKKYEKALENINLYIKISKSKNDKLSLASGYGLKGVIYYWKKEYITAETMYLKQNLVSIKNNDLRNIALSIANLISLYSFYIDKESTVFNKSLDELIRISKVIKKESYVAEVNYRLGIYLYNKKELIAAEKSLIKSLLYFKKLNYNYVFFSNLFYLGKTYFFLKRYSKAIRTLNNLIEISIQNNNELYLVYCYNTLGKIYYEIKEAQNSIKYFNSSVKLATIQDNVIILADSNKFLGKIHKELNNPQLTHQYFSESLKYYTLFDKSDHNFDISKEFEFLKNELRSKDCAIAQ